MPRPPRRLPAQGNDSRSVTRRHNRTRLAKGCMGLARSTRIAKTRASGAHRASRRPPPTKRTRAAKDISKRPDRSKPIQPHRNPTAGSAISQPLVPRRKSPVKWSTDFPPTPGFYWFEGFLGRHGDETAGAELVHILPTHINDRIPATVTVTGRNNKYGLHSCRGKWAGPLLPPAPDNDEIAGKQYSLMPLQPPSKPN